MRVHLIVALAAVLCLAACGTPGAPRPPSLDLPKPVADLSATRVGDKVTLRWTAPRATTDGTSIRHPGPTRICRDVAQPASTTCTTVAEVPPIAAGTTRNPVTRTYVDQLPTSLQTDHPTGFAQYAVVAVNDRGKFAGMSNRVEVPLAPTLPPPEKLTAQVTANGPVISWVVPLDQANKLLLPDSAKQQAPFSYEYRLYRRDQRNPNAAPVAIPTDKGYASPSLPQRNENVLDSASEWEHRYDYWVAIVTRVNGGNPQEVQGEASQPVEVFTHDVFPPAAPTGVQAVGSGVGQAPFVDLSWIANTEADLAGYNVYRHEEGQSAVKINTELVKAPAFRDSTVTSGHRYLYAVSAVDVRENESSHSAEAAESVP